MWDKLAIIAVALFLVPGLALAQAAEEPPTSPSDLNERLSALEDKASRADELEGKVADLEERLDTIETAALEKELEGTTKKLYIYGFFDSTLIGHFIQGKDSSLENLVTDKMSFTMVNLNLYLVSNFTETLRSLVELRFGFMPQGAKTYMNDQGVPQFNRQDTTMRNRSTTELTQYGSVGIERVQLTWQPLDQIGFTLGRFFTPFGIWNIDHGAPVVLPIFLPYSQLRQSIPLAQTGLMAHGKFRMKRVYLDYAVTVSNGRGPADAVYDIDQNKALGLKLKLTYSGEDVSIALGGYGYYGTSQDEVETFQIEPKYKSIATVTEQYEEFIGAADFLLELFGLRLQAESVSKLRRYTIPPPITVFFADATLPASMGLQPNNIQWDGYALLAYTLPLSKWFGDKQLTPYILYERSVQDDTRPEYSMWDLRGGLNLRLTPYIVAKAEYLRLETLDKTLATGAQHMVAAQVAVAF